MVPRERYDGAFLGKRGSADVTPSAVDDLDVLDDRIANKIEFIVVFH